MVLQKNQRQAEPAKLFQMKGNLSTSQGADLIPGSPFLCAPHLPRFWGILHRLQLGSNCHKRHLD